MKKVSIKELNEFRAFAVKTALEAGEILKAGFKKNKNIKYKGIIDPVTEFDLKSEKLIISLINKHYPTHSILAEEGSGVIRTSPFCWVVDPLDGTVNYAHRFPVYSVSIALMYNDRPIVGVVYDPERNEMFSAALNRGAWLNDKRIKVSTEKKLGRALLATGFAYNIKTARKNNLGMFAKMMKSAQAVRRLGSAALDLCWLACGRLDGFWEYYLHPWDTAAAILIVTEAGGSVSQISKKGYSIFDNSILASNTLIHKQIAGVLNGRQKN